MQQGLPALACGVSAAAIMCVLPFWLQPCLLRPVRNASLQLQTIDEGRLDEPTPAADCPCGRSRRCASV
ncbi:Uncharacterized protein ToN1_04320 [Aromatoleum petrolei]|nr:Uncharacterized protein ToN1_04320 [Aromatoleum petrolei]